MGGYDLSLTEADRVFRGEQNYADNEWITCQACNGSGESTPDRICMTCKGNGEIPFQQNGGDNHGEHDARSIDTNIK